MYWVWSPCIEEAVHVLSLQSMYWVWSHCIEEAVHLLSLKSLYWRSSPCIEFAGHVLSCQCIEQAVHVFSFIPCIEFEVHALKKQSMYWVCSPCIEFEVIVLKKQSMYWVWSHCIEEAVHVLSLKSMYWVWSPCTWSLLVISAFHNSKSKVSLSLLESLYCMGPIKCWNRNTTVRLDSKKFVVRFRFYTGVHRRDFIFAGGFGKNGFYNLKLYAGWITFCKKKFRLV